MSQRPTFQEAAKPHWIGIFEGGDSSGELLLGDVTVFVLIGIVVHAVRDGVVLGSAVREGRADCAQQRVQFAVVGQFAVVIAI